ncbi:hypothetical protein VTP01DRAFT_10287 [Rhizomucor pusillus]|uniref:uncharacterized protein n=1 Tax=Rhizomucor pusillus TaxID=4840 RepID=UPI003741F5A2
MRLSFAASLLLATVGMQLVSAADCSNKAYSQCGGQNWSGESCCISGYECKQLNDYYHQCVPQNSGSFSGSSSAAAPSHMATSSAPSSSKAPSSPASSSKTPSSPAASSSSSSSGSGYNPISGGASGDGTTTRYWDCCKASCSWPGKAPVTNPVGTCAKDGVKLVDVNVQSGCNGGEGYMCNDNQPWAVDDNLSYGFAAASISGKSESDFCCSCYELTFSSGEIEGKKMVVQVTNTGGDLSNNHFDLQIPGGGVGIFNGCQTQWDAPSDGWGQRYGGISSASECSQLPKQLQDGCKWRFDWFKNADNPNVSFKQVSCPAELVKKTGCERTS